MAPSLLKECLSIGLGTGGENAWEQGQGKKESNIDNDNDNDSLVRILEIPGAWKFRSITNVRDAVQ